MITRSIIRHARIERVNLSANILIFRTRKSISLVVDQFPVHNYGKAPKHECAVLHPCGSTLTSKEVLPYSLVSVGSGADPDVQAVSQHVTISHPPAVSCHYFPPGLHFTFVSVHQMAPPLTKVTDLSLIHI